MKNNLHKMTLDINIDTHAEFKAICAINKLSIREVLTERILEFIEEMKSQNKVLQTNNNLKKE